MNISIEYIRRAKVERETGGKEGSVPDSVRGERLDECLHMDSLPPLVQGHPHYNERMLSHWSSMTHTRVR